MIVSVGAVNRHNSTRPWSKHAKQSHEERAITRRALPPRFGADSNVWDHGQWLLVDRYMARIFEARHRNMLRLLG